MLVQEESGKAKRFLIIQTAFIGDVVLATSLIETLGSLHPHWVIDILVRKGNEHVLENNPNLNSIFTWNKSQNKLTNLYKTIQVVRSNKYDYVINLHRFLSSGLLTLASGARKTIGFDKNPLSLFYNQVVRYLSVEGYHEIDRNHSLLSGFSPKKLAMPKMYPSAADFDKVKGLKNGPYYCIAPASVWYTKQYPKDHWISLIRKIKYPVYLIGGEGDTELCNYILKMVDSENVKNLSGKLSFLETAALMKDATMNFVNDSAPLHFASAMNAPVTAYYCSTVPAFGFGPLSDDSKIMQTDKPLECRPCGLHGHKKCPKGHFDCAHSIAMPDL